ncbi:hypothetical protein MSAN_01228800 [Mycena sanguinolenta]|uniref:F-box domain-containing protein n=1 Tax=Mycena sanguinolenta TaxID=230812 RepID=A0A8H7D2B6_9AGAR|nr:hypothetical protein MSAN_01228800 [Mycena sanguinolenta]
MHHCLSILELIESICDYLQGVYGGLGTLAALARTCRTFHDPALDYVWADQRDGLVNLMHCMPQDLFEFNGGVPRLLRPILVSDWERPRFYTHRIRCISTSTRQPMSEALTALCASFPWRRYFLVSQVDVFKMAGGMGSGRFSLATSAAFPQTHVPLDLCALDKHPSPFSQCSKDMSHVEKTFFPTAAEVRSGLSSCLRNLHALESVHVEIPDMVTLEHLSQLDTLTSLTALLPEEPFLPGASLPFIALKRLDIMYDVEPVTDFFERCSGTPLKDVSIKLITCPTRAAIDRLHAALRDGCSHSSLLSLVIDISENYPLEPGSDAMTIRSLRPLFCFANLTSVSITSLGFDMDDQGMDELACSWPQLRILRLGFAGMNDPTELDPRFSLRSLSTLAKHCREFTALDFALNATVLPEPDPDVVPQLVLWDFDVGRSPITSPSLPVAQFIAALFPNVTEIKTWCTDFIDDDDSPLELQAEDIAHHHLWTEVAAQIPISAATREAEVL